MLLNLVDPFADASTAATAAGIEIEIREARPTLGKTSEERTEADNKPFTQIEGPETDLLGPLDRGIDGIDNGKRHEPFFLP
jgi:hypothetical protein